MYVWVSPAVSFPQVSSPKSCTCLSLPPNALHAPPISFFLILSLTQYWVFCLSQVLLPVLHSSVFPTWNCLDICKTVITLSTFMFVLSLGTLSHLILSFDPACKHFDGHDLLFFLVVFFQKVYNLLTDICTYKTQVSHQIQFQSGQMDFCTVQVISLL